MLLPWLLHYLFISGFQQVTLPSRVKSSARRLSQNSHQIKTKHFYWHWNHSSFINAQKLTCTRTGLDRHWCFSFLSFPTRTFTSWRENKSRIQRIKREEHNEQRFLFCTLKALNVLLFIRITRSRSMSHFSIKTASSCPSVCFLMKRKWSCNTMRSDVSTGWNSCARWSQLSHTSQLFKWKLLNRRHCQEAALEKSLHLDLGWAISQIKYGVWALILKKDVLYNCITVFYCLS